MSLIYGTGEEARVGDLVQVMPASSAFDRPIGYIREICKVVRLGRSRITCELENTPGRELSVQPADLHLVERAAPGAGKTSRKPAQRAQEATAGAEIGDAELAELMAEGDRPGGLVPRVSPAVRLARVQIAEHLRTALRLLEADPALHLGGYPTVAVNVKASMQVVFLEEFGAAWTEKAVELMRHMPEMSIERVVELLTEASQIEETRT